MRKTKKQINTLFFVFIALIILLLVILATCGLKVNEKEIKSACIKEAENFVGGYLGNSDISYLLKYEKDPVKALNKYKLKFSYSSKKDDNADIANRIADYILKHATFEVDKKSFSYNKDTEIAELNVNVTIIPPVIVRDEIEEIMTKGDIGGTELYDQAIAIIKKIDPVPVSVKVRFENVDGEWLIYKYTTVISQINDVGQVTENLTSSTLPSSKEEMGNLGPKGDKDTSRGSVADKIQNATGKK